MSSRPNACIAFATAVAAVPAPATSAARYAAAFSAPAVRLSASSSWSTRKTEAPSRAKSCAVAAPMPAPPPVISATLPSSRIQELPRIAHKDIFPDGWVGNEADQGVQQPPVVRHPGGVEEAGVRPVAAPDQPPRRDLDQAQGERRHVVVRIALPGDALGAADLGPEV